MTFDLKGLTDAQIQIIGNALAQRPWLEVKDLIHSIDQQIAAQLQAAQERANTSTPATRNERAHTSTPAKRKGRPPKATKE